MKVAIAFCSEHAASSVDHKNAIRLKLNLVSAFLPIEISRIDIIFLNLWITAKHI